MEYQVGSKVFDGWEISNLLGEGSFGRVFEICKEDYGVSVKAALKVIKIPKSQSEVRSAMSDGMDENSVTTMYKQIVDDLMKEIAILSSLKAHPNIVRYEDHKVEKQETGIGWTILIRMELLTPLNDYLLSHQMDENEVLQLGKDLSQAISYCEKKSLVHRDIKPENTFIDELGHFKLGDFGIARTAEKTTSAMSNKGTGSYMAPEVYLAKPYGKTVDIYSLGLMMYKLLNRGRLPFYPIDKKVINHEDRQMAIDRRIRGEAIVRPIDASEELSEIILKACAYNPTERFQSGDELYSELCSIEEKIKNSQANHSENADKTGKISGSNNSHFEEAKDSEKTVSIIEGIKRNAEYDKTSDIGIIRNTISSQVNLDVVDHDHTSSIGNSIGNRITEKTDKKIPSEITNNVSESAENNSYEEMSDTGGENKTELSGDTTDGHNKSAFYDLLASSVYGDYGQDIDKEKEIKSDKLGELMNKSADEINDDNAQRDDDSSDLDFDAGTVIFMVVIALLFLMLILHDCMG